MLKNTRESLALMSLLKANVIKILQIISVAAVILASILFVHIGVFGVQENESVKEILSLPSVKGRFIKTYTNNAENQASRLLREAEVFAQYLDFQEKTKKIVTENKTEEFPSQKQLVPPKFNVLATSYYETNPELSQVLIDEPGKGRYWVRQSNTVGRFLIEQVKDGLVIVKNGEQTIKFRLEQGLETGFHCDMSLASVQMADKGTSTDSMI